MNNEPERNDRDIWRMIERNPSIAYEDEIIAYDILAEEKRLKCLAMTQRVLIP